MILGVSNIWCRNKGLDDLLEISRMQDVVVIMVGMSNEQIQQFAGEEYKECNLITIKRTQNQAELAMLYSLADIFVNPTYADMFPTVNLEALACGTPIITYRTGGSPEAIDGKTGVVVEQGNVNALANAIMWMKANPLSSADCRKRAEVCFDKDKCFEEYIELYNRILSD